MPIHSRNMGDAVHDRGNINNMFTIRYHEVAFASNFNVSSQCIFIFIATIPIRKCVSSFIMKRLCMQVLFYLEERCRGVRYRC